MKASNPVVMVQAYRLLVAEMYVHGWDYPLHLGVTEAGEGEDGRMKSAIGIGTLLQVTQSGFHLQSHQRRRLTYCEPIPFDLYVGKTVVKRGIAMEDATDALIQLIKDHGRWVDPPAEE
ncbi:hypothetical protein REPUB_Repub11eG0179500 [Reevesia pubescens]